MVTSLHPHGPHHHGGKDEVLAQRMAAHDRLAHQSQIVLRLGQMLLSFGANAYRVKKSMADLARAVGISEHRAQVTYTEIIAAAYANDTFRTELAGQRPMGVDADKIGRINNYMASLNGKSMRTGDISDELDKIAKVPDFYDWFSNVLASGLACAAFAFLNSRRWVECSAVAVASFFGQALCRQMLICHTSHFGVWMACGALAAMIYILLVAPAQHFLGIESTHQAGFISALLFLVPGFPLVIGLIDLVRQDFQGDVGRLIYVTMLVVSADVDVWAISAIFGWSVTPEYGVSLVPWLHYLLRFLASFVAAYGFVMLFNSPQRVCATAALIDAVINTVRIALHLELGVPAPAAVGLAALAAGPFIVFVARRTRFPHVALSVPAVVIMIPDVLLYRAPTYLNNQQIDDALSAPFTVTFTIVAIGMGLAPSRMLTDKNWPVEREERVPNLWECEEENA